LIEIVGRTRGDPQRFAEALLKAGGAGDAARLQVRDPQRFAEALLKVRAGRQDPDPHRVILSDSLRPY